MKSYNDLALCLFSCFFLASCAAQSQNTQQEDNSKETENHRMRNFDPSLLKGFETHPQSEADANAATAEPPTNIAGANLVGECFYLEAGVLNADLGYLSCQSNYDFGSSNSSLVVEVNFRTSGTLIATRTAGGLTDNDGIMAPTISLSNREIEDIESISIGILKNNGVQEISKIAKPLHYTSFALENKLSFSEIDSQERLTEKSRKEKVSSDKPEVQPKEKAREKQKRQNKEHDKEKDKEEEDEDQEHED